MTADGPMQSPGDFPPEGRAIMLNMFTEERGKDQSKR